MFIPILTSKCTKRTFGESVKKEELTNCVIKTNGASRSTSKETVAIESAIAIRYAVFHTHDKNFSN